MIGGLTLSSIVSAQDQAAGTALKLPVSGTTIIVLPPGNANWRAVDKGGVDHIVSTNGPEIAVGVAVPDNPNARCGLHEAPQIKLAGFDQEQQSPAYLPGNFHPQVLQRSDGGAAMTCANRQRGGIVMVTVKSAAGLTDAATVARLKGLLKSVGDAFETTEGGTAPPSEATTQPRPNAAPPPAAEHPIGKMHTLTLPVIGASVGVPSSWSVKAETPSEQRPYDELTRAEPSMPAMHINVVEWESSKCDGWEDEMREIGGDARRWVAGPDYLPEGFHGQVWEEDGGDQSLVGVCVALEENAMFAMIAHDGPLTDPGFGESMSVLRDLAWELGATVPMKTVPAVIAMPLPPSTRVEPSEPSDHRPPPEPYLRHSGFDWDDFMAAEFTHNFDFQVGYLNPEGGFDGALGFALRFNSNALLPQDRDAIFGVVPDIASMLGVNTDGNVPFDLHVGLGPGLRLGPVSLAPVIGVGIDTMGAGGDYDMDAALYWYPAGKLRLGFGWLALDGYLARTFRGSIKGEAAGDIPNQTRVEVKAFRLTENKGGLFLGFHWTDMSRYSVPAQYMGGMIGFGAHATKP